MKKGKTSKNIAKDEHLRRRFNPFWGGAHLCASCQEELLRKN